MARGPSNGRGRQRTEPPEVGSAAEDPEPDPVSVARAIGLRQLAAAPRSRAQLESAMARRGVPADAAAQVLDRFTEVGLVDDAAYAELLVRSRHSARGLSRRALAHELRQKGVGKDVAERALGALDADQERRTARALVERKASGMSDLDLPRRRRRLAAMLARKGYPPDVALEVVDEVLRESPTTEGPPSD